MPATPTMPPSGRWKDLPARISLTGVDAIVGAEVEVEDLLPHGGEIDEVALLAGVLLRDLDFHGLVGLREAGEERRDGLAGLEVDGAFLGLDDDVGSELAVEGMEDVVGGAGAVGFGVVPVEVMVVDEGAVENDAAVGREGGGESVGGVGGGAAVAGGAGLAFGVGLDGEAGEVGDEGVDLVDLGGPPGFHGGIEGIVGGEAADVLRAGDVDADGETDAPGAHGVGDAGEALEHLSESRNCGAPLTLLTLQPLMPTEASRRAYSATGARSSRTLPSSKKMLRPA